jgi:exodeoxyribonuclease III
MKQSHRLSIVSWNVNGIRAAERKGMLRWLASANVDILALQEVKANVEQLSPALREPPGYHVDWCAAEKKGYSGVATFSRQRPQSVTRGLDDPRFDPEGRVLVSTFGDLMFFNVYFPSGSRGPERVAYKLAFYQRFVEVIRDRIAAGCRVVVAGDVNTAYCELDLARPRENRRTSGFLPEERLALEAFFEAGLIDSFRYRYPTRVTYSWWSRRTDARARNVGWRLDYIFVSPNLRDAVIDAEIHTDVCGSDHCPVRLTLELPA